jgi:hypothetical protein
LKAYFADNKAPLPRRSSKGQPHSAGYREKADEIRKRLVNGEDLPNWPRKTPRYSNQDDAGNWASFAKEMVKEFEAAAFSLKVGQISDP